FPYRYLYSSAVYEQRRNRLHESAECLWLFKHIRRWSLTKLLHPSDVNYALYYSINHYAIVTNGCCTNLCRMEKARRNGPEKTRSSNEIRNGRFSICPGNRNVDRI